MARQWPAEALNGPVEVLSPLRQLLSRRVHTPVTAGHLARGIPGSPTSCAVALAMIDAGFMEPHVEWGNTTIKGLNDIAFPGGAVIVFGSDVIKKIADFDDGESVEPFDMWMCVP